MRYFKSQQTIRVGDTVTAVGVPPDYLYTVVAIYQSGRIGVRCETGAVLAVERKTLRFVRGAA